MCDWSNRILREEIQGAAHGLRHAHAPHQEPDLGVEQCELETTHCGGVLVSLSRTGLHLQAPDSVVALDGLKKAGVVWVLRHDEGEKNTATDGDGTFPNNSVLVLRDEKDNIERGGHTR